jgi:23S rRNA (guanosine2251-2'-O)-methyltransferase
MRKSSTEKTRGRKKNRYSGPSRKNIRSEQPLATYKSTELIMGRNCIFEVLQNKPSRLRKVFVAERSGGAESEVGRRADLIDALIRAEVPFVEAERATLTELVDSESHQGFVAVVSPRSFISLDELVRRGERDSSIRILALDGLLDPQNIGAVLRAAECFGVTAVMWSRNRSTDFGPVIAKASVGASELVDLCPVGNLHQAIERLKAIGVWSIGAVVAPNAIALPSFDPPEKWVLVMGSEGDGIQRLIEKSLDFAVYIPMCGKISSLNVSQATAVMLSRLVEQNT